MLEGLEQIQKACNKMFAKYGIKPNVLFIENKGGLFTLNVGTFKLAVLEKPTAIENSALVGYVVPVDCDD